MTTQIQRMTHVHRLVATIGAALLVSFGCSSSEKAAYPVELEVFVKGKPATGATVVFHPVGGADLYTPRPTGKVNETGVVKLSTFAQDDGAPPGDYTVTVEWRDEVIVTIGSDKIKEFSSDKLKGKYKKPDAPTAPRATVNKQANKLPALQL